MNYNDYNVILHLVKKKSKITLKEINEVRNLVLESVCICGWDFYINEPDFRNRMYSE